MHKTKALFLSLICAGIAAPALAEMPKMSNGHWVDEQGATLYTFDKDSKGKSACDAACAANWPPAAADSYDKASGDWSVIKRSDGTNQWAYKGHPLYRFAKDKKPGDAMGDGIKGMWHVSKS
jgi:predicted lipoprotein with Yx(FWY)xxD motif